MSKKTVLMRLGSGAVAAFVASGAVLFGAAAANAAPPAGTVGKLTFTPETGTDLTAQVAHTSGACPTTADSANVLVVGPVGAANPTFPADNPYAIVTTTKASFSTTDPFDLPFRVNLKDAAADRGLSLQAGEYDVTARCVKGLTQEVQGTFTGALYFTSPTAYQVTDPNAAPTATTTVLSVSPASPAAAGSSETVKATVSPVAAGSVQFGDGASALGAAVPVSAGVATLSTTLPVGTHSLTAVFTPADPAAFAGSTSVAVPYEVKAPTGAVATRTKLSVIPNAALPRGVPRLLKADVTPVGAVGTVQFKDRGTNVGKPVSVVRGQAWLVTSQLATGSHSLTAVFTPANPAAFGPSTSAAVPVSVTAPAPRVMQQILTVLAQLIIKLLIP